MRGPRAVLGDEFFCHLRLARVVRGTECDVVDGAPAKLAGEKAFRLADVDDAANRFDGAQAGNGSVLAAVLKSQSIALHRCRARSVVEH